MLAIVGPVARAETVGSLLQPGALLAARAAGDAARLVDAEDRAVDEAIALQQEAGLDVISDGEMRRSSWVSSIHYLDGLATRPGPRSYPTSAAANRDPNALFPYVVEPIRPHLDHQLGEEYPYLHAHAATRTKYTMPAPSYHRRFWHDEHSRAAYASCEEFLADVRDWQRDVAARLAGAGCDYIQLDAPNYGSLCDPGTRAWHESVGHDLDDEIAFDGALDSSVFAGLDGSVTRAIHICRGNQSGGTWHSSGGYGALSGVLFPALDLDVVLLEYDSDRAGDFGPLAELKTGQTAVLGLLTTKTPDHERRDAVEARIAEAAEHKPLGELALSTQCGFASSTNAPMGVDDERAKLTLVGEIARGSGADDDVARIILGVGTSHSPLLSIPPEYWAEYARNDRTNRELAFPPDGLVRGFDAALESHVPSSMRDRVGDEETFKAQHARCNAALDTLGEALSAAEPDVTVVISDDQDEWFYDTNMPAFAVFWGASVPLIPRQVAESAPPWEHFRGAGYGDVRLDVAVPSALGRHVVEEMMAADFDVAQLTEVADLYGGRVACRYPTPTGETDLVRETAPRAQGLPHGFSFVVKRLFHNAPSPLLPVFQNTCYPPNQVRPHRGYDFGVRLAEAIATFPEDLRIAVVASGGLSHFVVDEDLDRALLDGIANGDRDRLRSLPRDRLYSATSESLNWVAAAGAMSGTGLSAELVDYVPVYRTEAGTGGGWAFLCWR